MLILPILLMINALATPAESVECPNIDILRPIDGYLLVSFLNRHDGTPAFACLIEGTHVSPVVSPTVGVFRGVNWSATPHEILISACDEDRKDWPRCHIERMTLDGTLLQTYPDLPVREFQEPDGRLSAGGAGMPVRASPTGEFIAASANGRSPALLRASDGEYLVGLTRDYSESAWSPDGKRLAFTRSPDPERSSQEGSQVFLYDLRLGSQTQLTHFAPKDYRAWWNPFAKPAVRPPLVAGLSWARGADVILFYLAPDQGIFFWNSKGEELHKLKRLEGQCWRHTQLSTDGERILYLAGTRSELCLLNAGDEIHVTRSDRVDDYISMRVRNDHWAISDLDWWTN